MLSSVTLNCRVIKIIMISGSCESFFGSYGYRRWGLNPFNESICEFRSPSDLNFKISQNKLLLLSTNKFDDMKLPAKLWSVSMQLKPSHTTIIIWRSVPTSLDVLVILLIDNKKLDYDYFDWNTNVKQSYFVTFNCNLFHCSNYDSQWWEVHEIVNAHSQAKRSWPPEAQKPKTFWMAAFMQKRNSGQSARIHFSWQTKE